MLKTLRGIALLVVTAAPWVASASTWENDPEHSSADFRVKHLMVLDVKGTMGPIQSTLELDDKDITKSTVVANVDVKKVYTREDKRDQHLRSPDFLNAEKWPNMVFKSTKVAKAGGKKLKITGDLTIKDITKPITLDVEMSEEIVDPFQGATRRAFTGTGSFKRADYAMTWNVPLANGGVLVGEDVRVQLDLEFIKKGSGKAAEKEKPAEAPAKK